MSADRLPEMLAARRAPTQPPPGGDAGAVQALVDDAVANGRGSLVQFPRAMRELDIRRPIRIPPHVHGLTLRGQNPEWTKFYLNFGDDLPPEQRVLFEVVSARELIVEQIGVEAHAYAAAVAVHRKAGTVVDNSNMTHPVWRHVFVQGAGRLEDGFVHTAVRPAGDHGPMVDQNDEHAAYHHCAVVNVTGSALVIGHSQAKAVVAEDFNWDSCGRYGIDATGMGRWGTKGPFAGGTMAQGGTFTASRCRGGESGIAEFGVGRPAGPNRVSGGDFERVRALLRGESGESGPSTNAQPTFIQVDRADTSADFLRPDGGIIALFNAGPLVVRDSSLGAGFVPRPGHALPRIYHASLGGIATIVEGVSFAAEGADEGIPFDHRGYPVIQERIGRALGEWNRVLRVRGNMYRSRGGGDRVVPAFEQEVVEAGAWP